MAVGPWSREIRSERPASSAARRARVFLVDVGLGAPRNGPKPVIRKGRLTRRAGGPLPPRRETGGLRRVVQITAGGQRSGQAGVLASSRRSRILVGSTRTPGPMVDVMVTFFRYLPLDAAGFTRSSSSRPAW